MKRFVFIIFSILLNFTVKAYEPSESAIFSLLTFSPGDAVYSQFGHSALRLKDSTEHIDLVFDYGTFVFDDVIKFASDFVVGNLNYLLDVRSYQSTILLYEYEGRGMVERKLNLTNEEKKTLAKKLLINCRPENRIYLYNFFEDNCATRIRDIFMYDIEGIQWKEPYEKTTWRNAIDQYIGEKKWVSFGIHLGLGLPADKQINRDQLLFLPDYLGTAFDFAIIHKTQQLCNSKISVIEPEKQEHITWCNNSISLLWIIAILFALLTIREFVTRSRCIWCDVLFFFLMGIVGIILWCISFVSIHSLVFPNFNTIWITPLHLLFSVVLLLVHRWRLQIKWYFVFAAAMCFVGIIGSLIFGQFIPKASWALLLIFIMRSLYFLLPEKLFVSYKNAE